MSTPKTVLVRGVQVGRGLSKPPVGLALATIDKKEPVWSNFFGLLLLPAVQSNPPAFAS